LKPIEYRRASDKVKCSFRIFVHFTIDDGVESANGIFDRNENPFDTGKLLSGQCEITVVDVLEHPELAEREKILATPTLVKVAPPPLRRLIGDLSDKALVLSLLDLGGGLSISSQTRRR